MVGKELPFVTYSQVTTDGTVNNTISYVDIGIILQVTPHINPQGLVTLDVYPEISEPTGESVQLNPQTSSPVIARRFAQNRVAILDGQTIVIGGLMEDRITKNIRQVPLLGDIPVLGNLFKRTTQEKTKTELLIFLTPHVAQQPDLLKGMSEDEKAGTKIVNDAVEKGAFEEQLRGMERGAASRPAIPWEGSPAGEEPVIINPLPGGPDKFDGPAGSLRDDPAIMNPVPGAENDGEP